MDAQEILIKMKKSLDVNLYYECSEELKRNFDFITEVIKIYKDDFDFVDEVAESYVKYIPEEDINGNPKYIELCMLLGQYVPKGHSYYEFYTSRLDNIYSMFLLHVMMVKDQFDDVSELGFSILIDDYGSRPNILDYFATRLTNERYCCNPCGSFEDLIHKNCRSADNIREEGYLDFFARNLYDVDQALSYYVFDNSYLLEDLITELDRICDNWDDYEQKLSNKCVSVIKNWVQKCAEESIYGDDFSYEQAMNEVIVSMNFCGIFGLDRKSITIKRGKVISFGSINFKKDLKAVIDKVLMQRLTITELENINLDEEEIGVKKVLKP